jgi:hypothetical protein
VYSPVPFPEWFLLGGDTRLVQTVRDSAVQRDFRFLVMQADISGAFQYKKFSAVVGAGFQNDGKGSTSGSFSSRLHYLMFKPSDAWAIRAGRFHRAYGINLADHIYETRRGLGWDQGSETYNVELSCLGEKFEGFFTGIWGRPDATSLQAEEGLAARFGKYLGERYKVGISYYFGKNSARKRHLIGPYFLLGFSKKFYLLSEWAFQFNQNASPTTNSQSGIAQFTRLGFEPVRGIHLIGQTEFSQLDLKNGRTLRTSFGGGLLWFPRPHFEFQLIYQRKKIEILEEKLAHYGWFLAHFYL